ncbi:hypothetical protein K438DRAFT_1978943 [Mycena galopus ATCC 62051]|nr:hypothetical protein K438DRAFT_1978943 [Mycena galopus ATCC 62051]
MPQLHLRTQKTREDAGSTSPDIENPTVYDQAADIALPDTNEGAIDEDSVPTALLPSHYILTVPHIHSGLPSIITPLDQPITLPSTQTFARGISPTKPFAPFRCFADYDFTSNCVRYAKSNKQIQQELDALHSGTWAGECKLTIRTVKDMRASLNAARQVNNIPFERTTIHVDFDGETDRFRRSYEVEIDFRDPWKVIQDWVCDETLAARSTWFSVRKYYCRGGRTVEYQEELFDEPWTGMTWREVDECLEDFPQGQTFLDILKCILPCLVHLLPPNSALVNALRALQQFRMLVGVHCSSQTRLAVLNVFVREYEIACRGVHDKDFNFLKQHYTSHAADDIRQKGTTNHMSTRTGEGFQQDVTRHYGRTNGKDAEHQMVRIDENEEAMARIDMIVADHKAREKQQSEDSEDDANQLAPPIDGAHWRLAAPNKTLASRQFEAAMCSTVAGELFNGFDLTLREFLATTQPHLQLGFETPIMVQSFRAIHINFQSKVDWTAKRDIFRCSASFHGRPRYNCILYNADVNPLSFARVISLLRCKVPNDRSFDLAYVRGFCKGNLSSAQSAGD